MKSKNKKIHNWNKYKKCIKKIEGLYKDQKKKN